MTLSIESWMLAAFVFNIGLILLDASLGYHLAPNLLRFSPQDEDRDPAAFVRTIRRMLNVVVLLYMFFNCLAYFRQDTTLLAVVTVVIMLDLGGQLYVRYRTRRQRDDKP